LNTYGKESKLFSHTLSTPHPPLPSSDLTSSLSVSARQY
jgi:hypothetical protein